MTPKDLYTEINEIITAAIEGFKKTTNAAQARGWSVLLNQLRSLDTDSAGNILASRENLRKLRDLKPKLLRSIADKKYRKGVGRLSDKLNSIKGLNDKYFGSLFAGFSANKQLFKEILSNSQELIKNSLLEAGINANVINPLKNIINQSVTSGAKVADMTETVRTFLVNDSENLGKLASYAGQITTDGLNQFNANYNLGVSKNLGIEYYQYQGALKQTSRLYCKLRAGKWFHISEIQQSAGEIWAGKISGTNESNILIYRGGYNCNHQYIGAPIDAVPKSVIKRIEDLA